jgi:hypothetical protein
MGALLFRWDTAGDAATFWAGGLMGTFGEYLCIHLGIWHYPGRAWDLPWIFGEGTVPMPATLSSLSRAEPGVNGSFTLLMWAPFRFYAGFRGRREEC